MRMSPARPTPCSEDSSLCKEDSLEESEELKARVGHDLQNRYPMGVDTSLLPRRHAQGASGTLHYR